MKRILCAGAAIVLAGCGAKEETTVVETPAKENVTIINPTAAPSPTPKTVVVKKPVIVKKTEIIENRKNVVIEKVAPTPKATAAVPSSKPVPNAQAAAKPRFIPPPPAPGMKTIVRVGPPPTLKPAPKTKAPRVVSITPPTATFKISPTPAAKPTSAISAALSVRAEVVSSSKVPNPSTVAYAQSLVFAKYRIVSVEKGSYAPKEILVAQWGMKDKKLTSAARLRAGDQKTLQLVPLASRPDLEKVMRNDDTNEYELEPYFAVRED